MKFIQHRSKTGDPASWTALGDKPGERFFIYPGTDGTKRDGYRILHVDGTDIRVIEKKFGTYLDAKKWLTETYGPQKPDESSGKKEAS